MENQLFNPVVQSGLVIFYALHVHCKRVSLNEFSVFSCSTQKYQEIIIIIPEKCPKLQQIQDVVKE